MNSGYFDEVYVAIPTSIADQVLSSYNHVLKDFGVGILLVDPNNREVMLRCKAKRLTRTRTLRLGKNEAWLKHVLRLEFSRKGYTVYLEAFVPKPWDELKRICGRSNVAVINQVLNRIDMLLVKSNCSVCNYVCGFCNEDIIGIEVKFRKERLSEEELTRLKAYAESGVLTKLYLAVDHYSNIPKLLQQINGIAGLLVVDPDSRVKKVLESSRLTPSICALFLVSPLKSSTTICDFYGDMVCKQEVRALTEEEAREWLLEKHPELKMCQNKCTIIYIGRSRKGRPLPYRIRL